MPPLNKPQSHWAILANYGDAEHGCRGWALMGIFNWPTDLRPHQNMRTALFDTRKAAREASAAVTFPKRRRVVKVDARVTLAWR